MEPEVTTRDADYDDLSSLGAILLLRAGGDITIPWEECVACSEREDLDDTSKFVVELTPGHSVRIYIKK